MKRMITAAALACALWGGELPPPLRGETPAGKGVYEPLPAPVDVKAQERIQQENGIPGGRGVPMHSYENAVKKDEPHEDHR